MQNVIGAKASRARLPSNGRSLLGWPFLRLAGSIVSTSINRFLTGSELLESSDCVGPGMVLICTSSPFRESDWGALHPRWKAALGFAWAMRRKFQQDVWILPFGSMNSRALPHRDDVFARAPAFVAPFVDCLPEAETEPRSPQEAS